MAAFVKQTLWPTLVWMGRTGIPTSSGILLSRGWRHVSRHIPGHIRERSHRTYGWVERSMSIEKGAVVSLVMHAGLISLAYFGLPWFTRDLDFIDIPISVEILNVSEKTSAPPSQVKKAEPKKPAPKPEPKKVKAQVKDTPPPPPPTPMDEEVAIIPKADIRPKAKVQPDKKPKPKKKRPDVSKAKPKRKPKPKNDFASVLKTLEDLKKTPPPDKKIEPKKTKKEKAFEEQIADALDKPVARGTSTDPISISEIDLVRRQIAACWNLPAGAKDAENLIVEIKVVMNRDGTVANARIDDTARMGRDPFYRAAAESALRAVLNPRCSPLKLPPDKFDRWQTMTLNFNPKELLGL